jgi:hypothetical protein
VADDRVASNLQSLEEFAQTMWFDCPTPGPDFGSLHRGNGDFPLALDAPFGVSGPMILDFGVLRALLSDWSSIQSVMSTGEPACLVLDYTRVMTAGLLCHPAPRVFYDLCRERLGETGILIVNICGGYFGSSRQIAKISASFDGQVLAVTDATRLNRIAFASCRPDFLSCAEMLCVPARSNQYLPPRLSAAAGRIAAAARLLKARRLPKPAEV